MTTAQKPAEGDNSPPDAEKRSTEASDSQAATVSRKPVHIPGPAKSIYGAYLGILALVLYSGFYYFHAFTSGWRYP